MRWEYDGSFEGFLSAAVQSYHQKALPGQLSCGQKQPGLFDAPQTVPTDVKAARKMLALLRERLGVQTTRRIYHAFLCDDSAPERDLLLYLRLGLKHPPTLGDLAHPTVYAVEQYEKRVLTTLHKLHAFTRFEELSDGMLYTRIAPPRNVLPLMGPHFRKRFGRERFILHDTARATAVVYDTRTLELFGVHDYDIPERSEDEARFQQLWKRFFDTVTIKERINPALQRQVVPLKYRTFMTEFMAESASLPL